MSKMGKYSTLFLASILLFSIFSTGFFAASSGQSFSEKITNFFSSISGFLTLTSPTQPISPTKDTITASPLTLVVTKIGSGTIKSTDGKIVCGSGCTKVSQTYPSEIKVTLFATPAAGYTASWSGCTPLLDLSACTVLVGKTGAAVTVTFSAQAVEKGGGIGGEQQPVEGVQPPQPPSGEQPGTNVGGNGPYELKVEKEGGTGWVKSDIAGIDCSLNNYDCSNTYSAGTRVKLSETQLNNNNPEDGSVFIGWRVNNDTIVCPTTSSCSVVMDSNKVVTAVYSHLLAVPNNAAQGTSLTITISGPNVDSASNVASNDTSGLTFGTPHPISADSFSMPITIASNAALGHRALYVTVSPNVVLKNKDAFHITPASQQGCSGTVVLTLNPSSIAAGGQVTPIASGLSGCSGARVLFLQNSYCPKIEYQQLYTNENTCPIGSNGVGCTGPTLTAPAIAGNYNYVACINKDTGQDTDFSDPGESGVAMLQVSGGSPPPQSQTLSIIPNSGARGTSFYLTVSGGSNFITSFSDISEIHFNGTGITFDDLAKTTIAPDHSSFTTPISIIPSAELGLRTLYVTVRGTPMTANEAFKVTTGTTNYYTLTITRTGTGSGTFTIGGKISSCNPLCSMGGYAPGTQITLTAIPTASSTFSGWTVKINNVVQPNVCPGTGACTITIDSDKQVFAGFSSTGGIVVGGGQQPIVSITSPPLNARRIAFGDRITFSGEASSPRGKVPLSYNWVSNRDGFLSDQLSFSLDNLSIGQHFISFAAIDDLNQVSTGLKPIKIIVTSPELGDPVKVIPRVVTAGGVLRAYDVPRSTPSNIPNMCIVSPHSGTSPFCSFTNRNRPAIETCPSSVRGTVIPVLEMRAPQGANGKHVFEIGARAGIVKKPVVQTGNITLAINSQPSTRIANLGNLTDADFSEYGMQFFVTSSEDINEIDTSGDNTKGLFYALYKIENCGLIQVQDLTQLEYLDSEDKKTFIGFLSPADCELGQTCKYIAEVIALGSAGGQLAEFSWRRDIGVLNVTPTSVNFGNILAGTNGTNSIVTVKNTGTEVLDSLEVLETDNRLDATLSKTTLQPNEVATLTVKLNIGSNALAANVTTAVELHALTVGQAVSFTLPITFSIVRPQIQTNNTTAGTTEGNLTLTPSSINFGAVEAGTTTMHIVSISNPSSAAVSGLNTVLPTGVTGTLGSTTVPAGGITTLTLVLRAPADANAGSYLRAVSLTTARGGGYTIPLTYTIVAPNATTRCPSVSPPLCRIGEHLVPQVDAQGCSYSVCAPITTTTNLSYNETILPVKKEKGLSTLQMIIIGAVVLVAILFILLIIAFRKRWLNLEDYPGLRSLLEEIGLLSLFEAEAEPLPERRFTQPRTLPSKPPVQQPSAAAKPPQYTPEQRAQIEDYIKKHPEYEAYLRKRYRI